MATRRSRVMVPIAWVDWVAERVAWKIRRWGVVKLLHIGASFSVLLGAITYIAGSSDRQRDRNYAAWQVINAAQGKGGSGGRIDALEDLNETKVSLEGVVLRSAWLGGVRLSNARLARAVLDSATLTDANLSGADLYGASLTGANLEGAVLADADLRFADLRRANLRSVDLSRANLENADLRFAQLEGTVMRRSNLATACLGGARMREVSLDSAVLVAADLSGAHMSRVDVRGTDFTAANFSRTMLSEIPTIRDVRSFSAVNIHSVNAWRGFEQWAVDTMGAVRFDSVAAGRRASWSMSTATKTFEAIQTAHTRRVRRANRHNAGRHMGSIRAAPDSVRCPMHLFGGVL